MTDVVDWLLCGDPEAMLRFVGRSGYSGRKLRLFACACARRIEALLTDERLRQLIGVGEAYAEGMVRQSVLESAFSSAGQVNQPDFFAIEREWTESDTRAVNAASAALSIAHVASLEAAKGVARHIASAVAGEAVAEEKWHQAEILRDVLGSPFHPVILDPAWRTSTTTHLAATIYDDRAFDLQPILADALEEAGCTDAAILAHCRGPGPHVRGCWVIDLLLGKQ
jgi:hypothetical protein